MEHFKNLPEDVILDILTRLPTESVLDCKLVSTNWRNVICRHPLFSKRHLHHLNRDSGMLGFTALILKNHLYYFECNENLESTTAPIQRIRMFNFILPTRSIDIIGSSNGLIYFVRLTSVQTQTYICNPITKEFLMLPDIIKTCCDVGNDYARGFGYISSTNEYKVLRIMLKETKFLEVYIYTLGSGNGWRNIGNFNFEFSKEWWGEGATFSDIVNLETCYDIWLLKSKNDNHGMEEREQHQSLGLSKEFRADKRRFFDVTKADNVLTYRNSSLIVYDPKASTSKTLVDFKERIRRVFPHKNTFVSLKELGEEDTKIMEPIEIKEIERAMTNL